LSDAPRLEEYACFCEPYSKVYIFIYYVNISSYILLFLSVPSKSDIPLSLFPPGLVVTRNRGALFVAGFSSEIRFAEEHEYPF
jgi:hypothetical protein